MKAQRTVADKATFRLNWAKAKLEEIRERKQFKRTWREVNTQSGEYLPFAVICQKEGGDDEAKRCAWRYAKKCTMLQGRWLQWNGMTERWEYLYIHKTCVQEFESARSMYVDYTDGKATVDQPKLQKGVRSGVKDGAKGELADTTISPKPKPKEKSTADKMFAQATKLKSEYSGAVVAAQDLLKVIDTKADLSWEWADNSQNAGRLRKALDDVNKAAALSSTHMAILNKSGQELKKTMAEASLVGAVSAFLDDLKPAVAELQKQRTLLLQRHKASG